MPRTSKAMAVLDKREAALVAEATELRVRLQSVENTLKNFADFRRDMQAAPRMSRRAKGRGTTPATNAEPTVATA
jgi:hypothetical protein